MHAIVALVAATFILTTTAVAQTADKSHLPFPHHPECIHWACAHSGDAKWNRHKRKERERREARELRERPPISGLEACIIRKESGGDPQAVYLGHYGIGQWLISTWLEDGGGRYGASPLEASYAEQEKILRSEGEAGMRNQQAQYDGC